jgi:hypothetical protein
MSITCRLKQISIPTLELILQDPLLLSSGLGCKRHGDFNRLQPLTTPTLPPAPSIDPTNEGRDNS